MLRKAPALPVLESWEAARSCATRMNNSNNQRVSSFSFVLLFARNKPGHVFLSFEVKNGKSVTRRALGVDSSPTDRARREAAPQSSSGGDVTSSDNSRLRGDATSLLETVAF